MGHDAARTNFVVVLVDDLGARDLGCYDSPFYETPNIDRLARQGVRFTSAYAAGSVCSPTRAAIMTGKYPTRLAITDWIPGQRPKNRKLVQPAIVGALPLEETTIAEALLDQGYRTFFAGKWHLGSEGFFPEDQGFEVNLGGHHRGSPPGGYFSPYKNPRLTDGPQGEYLPDRLTDESIAFMQSNRDEPFLLFLSYYTVHTPIQARKKYLPKYEAKARRQATDRIFTQDEFTPEHDGWNRDIQNQPAYATMVESLDENIGRLMAEIERLELADNTVVIFTSDNGGLSTLRNKRGPTSQYPLRAGKGWLYEGGIRVPLIIRGPGIRPSQNDVPVISMDLFPTLLDLARLPALPDCHLDGASLAPLLLKNQEPDRDDLYWHFPHYHGSAWTPGAAVRTGPWKLIKFYEHDKVELYHLGDDPNETRDLSTAKPQRCEILLNSLRAWQKATSAKLPAAARPSDLPSD